MSYPLQQKNRVAELPTDIRDQVFSFLSAQSLNYWALTSATNNRMIAGNIMHRMKMQSLISYRKYCHLLTRSLPYESTLPLQEILDTFSPRRQNTGDLITKLAYLVHSNSNNREQFTSVYAILTNPLTYQLCLDGWSGKLLVQTTKAELEQCALAINQLFPDMCTSVVSKISMALYRRSFDEDDFSFPDTMKQDLELTFNIKAFLNQVIPCLLFDLELPEKPETAKQTIKRAKHR